MLTKKKIDEELKKLAQYYWGNECQREEKRRRDKLILYTILSLNDKTGQNKMQNQIRKNNKEWIVINCLNGISTQIKVERIKQTEIATNTIKICIKGGALDAIRRYNQNSIEAYLKKTKEEYESLCLIGAEYRSEKENEEFVKERQEKERYYLEQLDKKFTVEENAWKKLCEDVYADCQLWLKDKDFDHLKQQLESLSNKIAHNVKRQRCYVFS